MTAGSDGAGLEPAEAPTGDTPRRVASRAAIYTVGSAAPAVASLVVIPLITRLLTQSEYDVVALGTVVIQVGVILVALGMGAAITREYILGEAGARGARGLVIQSALISVLIAGVALALGPLWGPAVLGRPWDTALVLSVVASLGGGVVIVVQAYLRGAERPVPFVLLAAGGTLVGPAVGLVVVLLGQRTATAYLAALAAGYGLSALTGIWITLRSGARDASWGGLRRALRLGAPTVPHQIAIYLAIAGLVVVADRLLDAGGTANIVLTLGAGATVLTGAMNNAWAPLIYKEPAATRHARLTSTTRVILRVVGAVVAAVSLAAPLLVQIASPPTYDHEEMIPAVVAASLSAIASVYYLASSHLILVRGRTGVLSVSTPTAVALGLVAAALAAPVWGLPAVGASYTVMYVLLALLTTGAQVALVDRPWRPPLAPATLVVVLASVTAAVALPAATGWWTVVRAVVALAAAALLLAPLGRALRR
ncbi:lipopolysaccharide biosynthesis protein [Cellulosimicrobium cellulans]|uniref:lipopolysaccharide biosynthesis protein n=1 Tax=Cellulosimicrobium cellulans TaxID=1710 RepID=UPI001BA535BF|nr:oligosaccharide flippase family protein [Cellulosimicrobium cellulans]